jgi:hypothetical protein
MSGPTRFTASGLRILLRSPLAFQEQALLGLLGLDCIQVSLGRTVNDLVKLVESRAMARAVPPAVTGTALDFPFEKQLVGSSGAASKLPAGGGGAVSDSW